MSDVQAIADRFEIEALRGEFRRNPRTLARDTDHASMDRARPAISLIR